MIILINAKYFTRMYETLIIDETKQETIKKYSLKVEEIPIRIPEICNIEKVTKVIFTGNKKYSQKIGDMIKENGIGKYNLNIEVDYM